MGSAVGQSSSAEGAVVSLVFGFASVGGTEMAWLALATVERGGTLALRQMVDDAVNYAGILRDETHR